MDGTISMDIAMELSESQILVMISNYLQGRLEEDDGMLE